jgi:Asp-tRNA(Asn)/Glu-tRNA(Gln) amidotransferase A subunit family amidase
MFPRLPLIEMARLVRERQASPLELVDAHLRRIECVNGELNAFIAVYAEEARARAREPLAGPLAGVPVTVKDSFDIAGKVTTGGSLLRRGAVASEDAALVARLKAAGAIILGKTNLPEFLMNYESDNRIAGRTNNPWNLDCTAGGSSGGEAAAIASFCSAGGIGSDAGGSIREPAHFCGIAGLKPTAGRCPGFGHWPSIAHPGGLLGVAGPMARSAADLKILFQVLAGYDCRDPFSVPIATRPASTGGVRIAVMEQFNSVPVQPVMREAVRRAARLLSASVEFDTRPLREAPNLWWFLFGHLSAQFIFEMVEGHEDELHWSGLEHVDRHRHEPPTSRRVCEVLATRDRLRAETLLRLEQTPVVLCPAAGVTAFPHRQRRYPTPEKEIGLFEAMMPLTVWNLLGFPAVTVPMLVGDDGLPAGIQLVGAPYSDELLLELAVQLEEARGPFPLP